MVSCLLMYLGIYNTTRELITKLYETSKKIIELQDNKDASNNDYYLSSLRENKLPFYDIDVFRIFALNKIGQYTKEDGTKTIGKHFFLMNKDFSAVETMLDMEDQDIKDIFEIAEMNSFGE